METEAKRREEREVFDFWAVSGITSSINLYEESLSVQGLYVMRREMKFVFETRNILKPLVVFVDIVG